MDADTQPSRERGAIEELVAKRIRPLKKKIQRLRNYAAQDDSALNADQRAALATLPQLEVAARELDDLAKQVEEAELVAAARQRELREAAEREHAQALAERMAEFHQQLGAKLGGFLSLHALLHPARPSDTENLTFAPLILPLRLQDEVLATDILRVARMYEDLVSASENAGSVLAGLVAGPREEDEEDYRVHHLLTLLSHPDPEPETSAEDNDTASNAAQPPMSVRDSDAGYTTPGVESEDTDTDTDTYPPDIDPLATPVATMRTFDDAAAANMAGTTRGVALNFLQEDELAADADAAIIETSVEQTYEVIEPPSALASSAESVAADTPSSMDWTADDEATDDVAAALLEAALTPGATPGAATPDVVAVTVEAVTVDSSGAGTPAEPAPEAGETLDSDKPQRQRKPRKPRNRNGDKKDAAPAQPQNQAQSQNQNQNQGQNQAPGKGKPRQTDDDGFEVKVARRASAQRGRGGRGRGTGRGGAPREGQRPKDGGQQGGTQQGQGPKRTGGAGGGPGPKPKEAKPKPSIYKATQPAAPASAPIF